MVGCIRAKEVRHIDHRLQNELGTDRLQLAYRELSPPTLMDVVEAAVQHGITKARVFARFLALEGHVTNDVLPLIREVRAAFPSIEIELLPPLGQQPMFREMLRLLVTEDSS